MPGEHNGGHGAGTQFHGPPEKINVVAMLKEVNQNFPNSNFESYLRLEQQIAKEPGNYKGFAVDFNYRDPVGPELTKTEQVPTEFKATWTDAKGVPQSLPFANQ
ncbi:MULTISPECIES: DNA/RNA non-specific endonuclease [Actinomyces]|nr:MULTISPECIES: DNA/RNA non-specific endonuclease [Actinomyces]